MTILRNRVRLTCIAIFVLVSLTACSREFMIKPSGNFDGQIIFSFYKSLEANETTTFNIVEFVLQEKKVSSDWQIVWELKGKQSLNAITYANEYDGLEEIVPAKSLSREAKYRVLVTELGRTSPIGYSAVYFTFDQNGTVMAASPE